jgi:hypothetical protein
VRHGLNGLLVPARDSGLLAAAVDRFVSDREFLWYCSEGAFSERKELSIDAYQERLSGAIRTMWDRGAS